MPTPTPNIARLRKFAKKLTEAVPPAKGGAFDFAHAAPSGNIYSDLAEELHVTYMRWFHITYEQHQHLFEPGGQQLDDFGYPHDFALTDSATTGQVVSVIDAFCDYYDPSITPNFARLRKLAATLVHEATFSDSFTFNFNVYHANRYDKQFRVCGTMACAIGLCPMIWPDDWMATKDGDGQRQHIALSSGLGVTASAMKWFGLDQSEVSQLFHPDVYPVECDASYPFTTALDEDATAAQVAQVITAFCDYHESSASS